MKYLFITLATTIVYLSCTNAKKEDVDAKDKKIALRSDTINVVTTTDTLVIHESTCRGCAYEQSTNFELEDTLGIVKLLDVITTDNNDPSMNGGNISKDLIIIPLKKGFTTAKLYKHWKQGEQDTTNAILSDYQIDVRNPLPKDTL